MEEERKPLENRNFIDAFIEEDLAPGGRFEGKRVHTRFPPEPNGYLHIGHCKALTIDFGTAEKFGGLCNLRMDDTNPTKEDTEYVDAIQADIHWLGFDWGDRFFYGSDYFEKDYEYAVELIKKGLAYVCDLTPEQAREYRGDIGKPAVSMVLMVLANCEAAFRLCIFLSGERFSLFSARNARPFSFFFSRSLPMKNASTIKISDHQ